jgi:MFS family permease
LPRAGERREGLLVEESWTLREALRTRTLWLLIFTLGVGSLALQSINLHLMPYLQERGYAVTTGALVLALRSLVALVVTPLWGYLADRVEPRLLMGGKFLLYGVGIFLLMVAPGLPQIIFAVALYTIAFSGTAVVGEVIWARYFGRHALGSIRGFGSPFTVGFGAVGPLLAGVLYQLSGNYISSFWFMIAGASLSAVLILFCTQPRRRPG